MKALIASLILLAVAPNFASANPVPTKDVTIGLAEVFVPGGFSSSTNAYVIVSGMFPNSCYNWKTAQVTSPSTFSHEIRAIATVSQTMCLMVMIPFQKEVDLGTLASGVHTLRFISGDDTYFEKQLTIE